MRILTLFLALFSASMISAAEANLGDTVDGLTLKDIRYLPRTLDELGRDKPVLLAFSTLDEESSRAMREALKEVQLRVQDGAVVASVNLSAQDTIMEMAEDALAGNAEYLVLKDTTGEAAKALGIEVLPAVAILDGKHRLVYRGDLAHAEEALAALAAGKEVSQSETAQGVPAPSLEVPPALEAITFSKHVAAILYDNCVECHRPGASAPFSLLSYRQAASRADMIREVVLEERMPPWYASRAHGDWTNERGLTPEEKRLVAQWVEGGSQEGKSEEAPPRPHFPEAEWQIETPDLVLTAPEPIEVPAEGYVPYEYVTLNYQFPADTYIQGIEVKPGNRAVVHHANLVFSLPGKSYDGDHNFLTGYVPGGRPAVVPSPIAYLVPKGAVLTLQIHYVTTGKRETDQISVGIRYARGTVTKQLHYRIVRPEDADLVIPPRDGNYRIAAERTLEVDALPLALFSHMHLRGRDMSFFAEYPDGKQETLLVVPNYSFDWQLAYLYAPGAAEFPQGTKIRTVSHYDNSAFNPYNPDPSAQVEYGPQTIHEMNDAYLFFLDKHEMLDIAVDPSTGQAVQKMARDQQVR